MAVPAAQTVQFQLEVVVNQSEANKFFEIGLECLDRERREIKDLVSGLFKGAAQLTVTVPMATRSIYFYTNEGTFAEKAQSPFSDMRLEIVDIQRSKANLWDGLSGREIVQKWAFKEKL
jgi:hypothetical protein